MKGCQSLSFVIGFFIISVLLFFIVKIYLTGNFHRDSTWSVSTNDFSKVFNILKGKVKLLSGTRKVYGKIKKILFWNSFYGKYVYNYVIFIIKMLPLQR